MVRELTIERPVPLLLPIQSKRLHDQRVRLRIEIRLLLMTHLVVVLDHLSNRLRMSQLPVDELTEELQLETNQTKKTTRRRKKRRSVNLPFPRPFPLYLLRLSKRLALTLSFQSISQILLPTASSPPCDPSEGSSSLLVSWNSFRRGLRAFRSASSFSPVGRGMAGAETEVGQSW